MLIVERIENGFAVCETPEKAFVNIELGKLPPQIREGSCLVQNADGSYSLDIDEEERRRKKVQDLTTKLFKKHPKD